MCEHDYACTARYCYGKSLRLSITLWYCIKTNTHIVKLFPLPDKGMNLVFLSADSYKISRWTLSSRTPFPFGRICFVVLVMRKGGESSWSGPWPLVCTLEFSTCTATRTSSYSPVGPSVFFVYLAYICILCIHLCYFDLFVCSHPFLFPWAVESSPLQLLALA